MAKIRRAILSVSDKTGILELGKYLVKEGVEILSTGGTEKLLRENGVAVTPIEAYTGFPEMMEGRVKTLHPKVHGGILQVRDNPEHRRAAEAHGISPIDLVVVNLYPFVQTIQKADVTLPEAIENIDIGGPSMLRAAAKNYRDVTVICDSADYDRLKLELENHGFETTLEFRFEMAAKVFSHTAAYDGAVGNFLTGLAGPEEKPERKKFSRTLTLQFRKIFDLRYGENPHQEAAYYSEGWKDEPCVGNARKLHGKELSYNNILDLDAALETVKEFEDGACAIIKHNNPCGVAVSEGDVAEAFLKAKACDETSAFGGIIAFNRAVSRRAAEEIAKMFFEAVIAPGFDPEALAILQQKKNLRLLRTLPIRRYEIGGVDMRKVVGGLLVQDRDVEIRSAGQSQVVTKRKPTEAEILALDFAWRVAKHVKSNAIVYALRDGTVGIGAGQMSRVDSVRLAAQKALGWGEGKGAGQSPLTGTVMASDAFFPFRDGIDLAASYGITAVIQPGGSVKDEEVIQAADEHGLAMVFTGMRHFRH